MSSGKDHFSISKSQWTTLVALFSTSLLSLLTALLFCSSAIAQTEAVLHSFSGAPDGAVPYAALVRDKRGNLYGTTTLGGASDLGTVFRVTPKGVEAVVYSFSGADGANPNSALVLDKQGNFYGVARGGAFGRGVVFKLAPAGAETVLYNFTGGADGGDPNGPLIFDKQGNLYGAAGGGTFDAGVVFKLTPSGVESVVYTFTGYADGGAPNGPLVLDAKGHLYGTGGIGGNGGFCPGAPQGCGVVFKISSSGSETLLHNFQGDAIDAFAPTYGLIRDRSGNLYGTTMIGGQSDRGALFEVTPSGTETVLVSFIVSDFGYYPSGGLLLDKAGSLYGTTTLAAHAPCYCGAVYELGGGTYQVLYNFSNEYFPDGIYPYAGLVFGTKGRLYGTTTAGGTFGKGTIFVITP